MSAADVCLSPVREGPGYAKIPPLSDDSICIYVTIAGSVIPVRVLESDSIASVKLRIQTSKGYKAKKQKLVFAGRELARNNSLVREYGVTNGNVVHLVLRVADLLVITITTASGDEFEFQIDPNENIGYLKKQLAQKENGLLADLEDQELLCNGEKLYDQNRIVDICKETDIIHLVVQKSTKISAQHEENDVEFSIQADEKESKTNTHIKPEKEPSFPKFSLEPMLVNPNVKLSPLVWDMINSTLLGLKLGKVPRRSSEGTGGTYLMPNVYKKEVSPELRKMHVFEDPDRYFLIGNEMGTDEYISVFKPMDEEPNAVYNPHGLPMSENGEGLKSGTRVGEGAFREVAAYLLDHPKGGPRSLTSDEVGFAGVPPTVMVQCLHGEFNHPDGYEGGVENVKIGSLQMFVKNDGSCEDMGPSEFLTEEVHKLSVVDIRMANADRHGGNILMRRENGTIKLIPIDHGYCLPENFEDCTFEWLYWPQARQSYSHETVEYIKSLDAEKDIELLKFYGWDLSFECAQTLCISTMLLKKGAEKGLSPFQIGNIMCRETLNKESVIETIVKEAKDTIVPGMTKQVFLEAVSQIMDLHIDGIAQIISN